MARNNSRIGMEKVRWGIVKRGGEGEVRDFVELASSIDQSLPIMKQKEIMCDALLEDLRSIKGRDLAPYLLECVFDTIEPGTRIVLKFPLRTHIIDSLKP